MSNYVVIARFDEKTDEKIISLRNMLETTGHTVPEWPPHITIAAYENFEAGPLCEWTDEFSSSHEKLNTAFHSISILPPGGGHTETAVLCLNPAHSKVLVDFYYAFHEKYEDYCTGIGFFNSVSHGNPVIHATVGVIRIERLQQALELAFSSGVFREAEIGALEVYTYPMELIKRFELK